MLLPTEVSRHCEAKSKAIGFYEGRKKDLEEIVDALCEAYDKCAEEKGAGDVVCIALNFAKQDAKDELEAICELID